VVDDLVEGQEREVERHHLGDRPQPDERGADCDACDRLLGDRRVAHAPLPELLDHPLGDLVGALVLADLLAEEEDGRVAPHLLLHGLVEGLAHRDDGHG
jgi:hypothetical protein